MTEKPIIFNGEMVRAILSGRKTQTRRVIKTPLEYAGPRDGNTSSAQEWWTNYSMNDGDRMTLREVLEYNPANIKPYYGSRGDRLWVRETWCYFSDKSPDGMGENWYYRADGDVNDLEANRVMKMNRIKWKPSIHMPRWASRITLEITNVRVERVQDISEEDVAAEGVALPLLREYKKPKFQALWDSINQKRGYGWDVNPWVWVIEFKMINHEE